MSSTNRAAIPRVRATPRPRKTVAPVVVEAAAPDSRQAVMLAADGKGNLIVSVHVKRTYQLLPTGECRVADEQAPFLSGEPAEPPPDAPAGASPDGDNVFPELDIIPHKLATDLIVMASAHARAGKPTKRMIAGIDCGELQHRMLVQGNRRSYFRPDGQIGFTDAEPFEVMPLRYERAYGGCDPDPGAADREPARRDAAASRDLPAQPGGTGLRRDRQPRPRRGARVAEHREPARRADAGASGVRRGARTGGASRCRGAATGSTPAGTPAVGAPGRRARAPARRRHTDGGGAARLGRRRPARALCQGRDGRPVRRRVSATRHRPAWCCRFSTATRRCVCWA